MNARINYAAVVVSAVLYFALGAAWFTALSKPWAQGAGFTPEQIAAAKPQPLPFIGAFIANLVLAYVLAWLVARTGETNAARGAKLGALLWVGLGYDHGNGDRVRTEVPEVLPYCCGIPIGGHAADGRNCGWLEEEGKRNRGRRAIGRSGDCARPDKRWGL
jgi:hypothetical protein